MKWLADNNPRAFVQSSQDRGCVPIAADRTDAVLDLIMANAPADEQLAISVSRLCRAVGYMGFPCVSAFSAWLAYRTFTRLKELQHGRRNTEHQRKPA